MADPIFIVCADSYEYKSKCISTKSVNSTELRAFRGFTELGQPDQHHHVGGDRQNPGEAHGRPEVVLEPRPHEDVRRVFFIRKNTSKIH